MRSLFLSLTAATLLAGTASMAQAQATQGPPSAPSTTAPPMTGPQQQTMPRSTPQSQLPPVDPLDPNGPDTLPPAGNDPLDTDPLRDPLDRVPSTTPGNNTLTSPADPLAPGVDPSLDSDPALDDALTPDPTQPALES